MISLLVLAAALGPCADVALCTAKLRTSEPLLPRARAALALVPLKEGEGAPAAIKPKTLAGDVAFSFEVELQGAQVLVRAISLHRPPQVYGLAKVTVQAVKKPAQQEKALTLAIRQGMERAMENLREQLAEAAGLGSRKLRLSVLVNGLDTASRRHVAEVLQPCLKRQFDALGPLTEPHEVAGYLVEDLEYAPAKDEPRDSLQWQADRLRGLTLAAKAQCEPLPKVRTTFIVDAANHGVVVNFAR